MFWPSRPRLFKNGVGLGRCLAETPPAPLPGRGRCRADGLDRSLRSPGGRGVRTGVPNAEARHLDRHARGRNSGQLLLPRHVHQPGSAGVQAAWISWSLRRRSRRTAVREKRLQKRVAHNRDGHALAWGIRRVLTPHLRRRQLSAGRMQTAASCRPTRLSARQRGLEGRLFSPPCLRPNPALLPHGGLRPTHLAPHADRAGRVVLGDARFGSGFPGMQPMMSPSNLSGTGDKRAGYGSAWQLAARAEGAR